MEIKGSITILCDEVGAKIEVHDEYASITFARIVLTPEQLSQALGRLSHTECKYMEVIGLDRVGKTMEHKKLEFELPGDYLPYNRQERDKILFPLAEKNCPDGWVSDNYFNSQDSFFKKDGKNWARTTMRRWV